MPEDYLKDLIKKVKRKKGGEAEEPVPKPAKPVKGAAPVPPKKEMPAQKPAPPSGPKPGLAEMKELMKEGAEPPEAPVKAEAKTRTAPEIKADAETKPLPAKPAAPAGKGEDAEKPEKETKSEFSKQIEKSKKIEIASYGSTRIFKIAGQPLLHYEIPVPRPNASEKMIINTIKEAATRIISIAPYKIRDPEQRRQAYFQRIMEILRSAPQLNIPQHRFNFYAEAVVREMVGYGMIDPLIKDDKLEEIMVIGPNQPVYIFHREYEMMTTNIEFYADSEIQDLINRIARQVGRRVDISAPLLDARLVDGSRVNATMPPASIGGSTLTIRKFRKDPYSVIDLINMGTISEDVAAFLWLAVEGMGVKPANILIAGGTGSGKTTLLNVLASFIPPNERIVSIEDTSELNLPLRHWIRLEARPPGLEEKGEITLDILTKNSLRMRPDRVLVGEVRHDEAFTLFTAMNTGHDGCLGTIHSNSPRETIARVTSPPMNVPEIMLAGLDFIVIEHRIHDKKKGTIRRVTEIAEVTGVLAEKARTQTLFEWDATTDKAERGEMPSAYLRELEKYTGMARKQIEAELNARAKFLKKLADNNIRDITEVSSSCHGFIADRGGK